MKIVIWLIAYGWFNMFNYMLDKLGCSTRIGDVTKKTWASTGFNMFGSTNSA